MNNVINKLLMQSLSNDPRIKQIMDEVSRSGMTAEEYFYKVAKEKGVDPQSILSKLK